MGLKGIDESATRYKQNQDYNQRQAYYDKVTAGKTGGGGGGSLAGPRAFFNRNPADTEPLPTREDYAETVDGMPANNAMPGFTGGFSAGLNEPAQNQELPWSYQMPNAVQPTPEVKQAFDQNQQEYLGASPDKQQAYQNNLSSTTTPIGTSVSQFDFSNIKSLRNVVGIAAPVEKTVEVPESLSITENDKGTSYLTKFNKKTTNENVITKSGDLVLTDVPKALRRISSNKTLSKFFKENDLGQLDIGEKSETDDTGKKENSFYIGIPNKKDSYITISKDDFDAASIIQNLPSSAKTLDSTFIITDKPLPKEEPAAAPTERFPERGKAKTATQPTQEKELSLEERLSQKTTQATSTPTRTVTPQQQAQLAKSQAANKVSTLRSEKTKLERLIYDVSRASGKSSLKRGLTENDPDVIAAKKRISEIDKELE
jgi:hypothetical protein